jgi:hypothetical protein
MSEDVRPPLDNVGFNDPEAWGFCSYCAFLVGAKDGLLLPHRRVRNGAEDRQCNGSFGPADAPVPEVAKARPYVGLRKLPDRARARAHAQRERWAARGMAERPVETETQDTDTTDDVVADLTEYVNNVRLHTSEEL